MVIYDWTWIHLLLWHWLLLLGHWWVGLEFLMHLLNDVQERAGLIPLHEGRADVFEVWRNVRVGHVRQDPDVCSLYWEVGWD